MESDTSTNKNGDVQDSAQKLAQRTGAAAQRVGGAARSAGHEVGDVAREELANLRADLDDLISRIPNLSDIDLEQAKEKLMERIASTREAARDLADDAREQLDHGIECSREYVKDRPLQSVGYAAGIGFIVGLLMARR
ncbi:MAG: DUF883 domain-containing protein [Nitrosospira sp.]|nr:DUF883 domain-containing protein [Nitrosospira sp.]